jgi:hypothetical protein
MTLTSLTFPFTFFRPSPPSPSVISTGARSAERRDHRIPPLPLPFFLSFPQGTCFPLPAEKPSHPGVAQ